MGVGVQFKILYCLPLLRKWGRNPVIPWNFYHLKPIFNWKCIQIVRKERENVFFYVYSFHPTTASQGWHFFSTCLKSKATGKDEGQREPQLRTLLALASPVYLNPGRIAGLINNCLPTVITYSLKTRNCFVQGGRCSCFSQQVTKGQTASPNSPLSHLLLKCATGLTLLQSAQRVSRFPEVNQRP